MPQLNNDNDPILTICCQIIFKPNIKVPSFFKFFQSLVYVIFEIVLRIHLLPLLMMFFYEGASKPYLQILFDIHQF